LTHGLDFKNDDDSQADKSIRDKINDILARIPEEFELEENLTEILKLVLDQELQVTIYLKQIDNNGQALLTIIYQFGFN
jgi:hypothetical protein